MLRVIYLKKVEAGILNSRSVEVPNKDKMGRPLELKLFLKTEQPLMKPTVSYANKNALVCRFQYIGTTWVHYRMAVSYRIKGDD